LNKETHTKFIKQQAQDLGFMHCGISQAAFLENEAPRLEQWLQKGMHGQMKYMENYFDMRIDPRKLMPGAKSVISLLLNYFPAQNITHSDDALKISKYAYGDDYHHVIKSKLKLLLQQMQMHIGNIEGRAFVDSAPVLDKAWAAKSGLGWIGKNANLINPKAGSFFFIAELIVDIELNYDNPMSDYCGTCNRCVEACPTQAIVAPHVVDGSKCISYFTIELKEAIPEELKGKFQNWIFGCDVCQDVCPWNRFSKPTNEKVFEPNEDLLQLSRNDYKDITEEIFTKVFSHSAIKRTKYNGLKRNIDFVKPPKN